MCADTTATNKTQRAANLMVKGDIEEITFVGISCSQDAVYARQKKIWTRLSFGGVERLVKNCVYLEG